MAGEDATGFTTVDAAADPTYFIRLLEILNANPFVVALKRRMLDRLAPKPGQCVLDVGCGLGNDIRAIAGLVAPGGSAVGIDASEVMVAEARRRSEGLGLPVEFRLGDAAALEFDDASFDAVQADRVLIHMETPAEAMAEMARVTRPGGRVVIFDADAETIAIDGTDYQLARRMVGVIADGLRSGRIGRQLPALFRAAGLVEVDVVPHTTVVDRACLQVVCHGALQAAADAGAIGTADVAHFWAGLEQAETEGRFFAAFGGFIATGVKPWSA